MFNAAQMLQIALGLFTTKKHHVTLGELPAKKERKIRYGDGLTSHFNKQRVTKSQAKKA